MPGPNNKPRIWGQARRELGRQAKASGVDAHTQQDAAALCPGRAGGRRGVLRLADWAAVGSEWMGGPAEKNSAATT